MVAGHLRYMVNPFLDLILMVAGAPLVHVKSFLDLILMVAGAPLVHVKTYFGSDPDGGGCTFGTC